jgi:biopolymer transport protein ExbB
MLSSKTFALLPLFLSLAVAAPKEDAQLDNLKRELSALESLRAEKLEALEKKESARWEARYKTSAQAKEAEERIRSLEEAYGRLSGEAGRLEEDWVKTRNEADEKKEELEAAQEGYKAFVAQVKRRVDEAASGVSSDIPIGIEARTLAYSNASQRLSGESPDVQAGLDLFWSAGLERLDLTRTRSLESRQALFEDGRSLSAWRLRLGTVFVAELAKEGDASQLLLRTGSLQGKTFAWRQNLSGDYNARLREAVQAGVQGKESAVIPFDVLQFKSTGSGFVRGEEETAWNTFKAWFKAGGVTLYPLFAVGFLALFMIVERLIFYWRRSENTEKFMRGFRAHADKGDWQGAAAFAARHDSSLGNVMQAVAENAHGTRDQAERAVREVLLKEVPAHEKRLSLLAATGTAAPLLGLLGTVSGLVTLFKTMNQIGGNDPKILSGGISEALINAETGLAIAIPVLLVHGWLQERADTLNATLSAKSLEMLNRIWPQG